MIGIQAVGGRLAAGLLAWAVTAGPAAAAPPGRVVKDMSMTSKPVTVDVPLDDRLRADLEAAARTPRTTVRLTIRGLLPPAGEAVTGFTVFVNKPDAGAKTSADDPHFAAAAEFQPTGPAKNAQSVAVDLTETLAKLGKLPAGKPLQITLVPVPNGDAVPADTVIPFKAVEVEVIKR